MVQWRDPVQKCCERYAGLYNDEEVTRIGVPGCFIDH